MSSSVEGHLSIGSLEELRRRRCKVTAGGEYNVAVFYHDGQIYAVDDRRPHSGYGLNPGTVEDGVVTRMWHQSQFDLASGASLDSEIDNISTFPLKVLDGEGWLNVNP